jgi:hypothetical protein
MSAQLAYSSRDDSEFARGDRCAEAIKMKSDELYFAVIANCELARGPLNKALDDELTEALDHREGPTAAEAISLIAKIAQTGNSDADNFLQRLVNVHAKATIGDEFEAADYLSSRGFAA